MAGRGYGEFERRGATRDETRQVSVTSARVLRAVVTLRFVRQVVRLHRQGQFT